MKRLLWKSILILALIGALAACGGGAAPEPVAQSEAPAESAPAEEAAAEPVEEAAPIAEEAPPAGEEGAAEEPEASDDMVAGLPASGIDPDTGLEINPEAVVPGVDFMVRGEIVNANLTPQESPEFLILAPTGTRYRIKPQPVSQIFYEDGTQPALHEYQRGVLVQATVRQDEGAGATITVASNNLMLLQDD